MKLFTIGFTKKSAEKFFTLLKTSGARRIVDVRLNNVSQLAGFAKRDDLFYFLRELCGAEYVHEPLLAPTKDILDAYKKHKGNWDTYEEQFLELMASRRIEEQIDLESFSARSALLCSEHTADHCHRRLVLEYLKAKWDGLQIVHL